MTRSGRVIFTSLALVLLGTGSCLAAQVPATLFDMHMTGGITGQEPWPVDSFAGMRLWDSDVAWSQLNPGPGVYDWRLLNIWMNHAEQNDVDILYAFGRTPTWASSKPNDVDCANEPGSCDPPNDLNSDGTGPNLHWKNFVTAIATHSGGRIHYWEVWDEGPNKGTSGQGTGRWKGTIKQMIRMAQDARTIILSIDPTAVILAPSGDITAQTDLTWFSQYFAAGGGRYADVMSFHGYVQGLKGLPVPENLLTFVQKFRTLLNRYKLGKKPLWDTEGSWGVSSQSGLKDADMQAGFVARFYLMHYMAKVARFYWYEWDNTLAGTLWNPNTGVLLKPGIAYGTVYTDWMVGRTVAACSNKGTVWTCGITGASGYQAQAVWDTSKSCSNGKCTYSKYTVDPVYVQYETVYGQINQITGSTVNIGYLPILLQNQNP